MISAQVTLSSLGDRAPHPALWTESKCWSQSFEPARRTSATYPVNVVDQKIEIFS